MNEIVKTIDGACGRFILQENGIIYFYKKDNIVIDETTAQACIESIQALDNSGRAKLMVIQGNCVEYTFNGKQTVLTTPIYEKVALVTRTKAQHLVGEILQDMTKAFKSSSQSRKI
jgi:hypothetical protein